MLWYYVSTTTKGNPVASVLHARVNCCFCCFCFCFCCCGSFTTVDASMTIALASATVLSRKSTHALNDARLCPTNELVD